MISAVILILITILFPPVGVLMVSGCGADFCINLLLTILGFFPGHIHAFYIEYIYYKRREDARNGIYDSRPAPGVYSDRVNNVGREFQHAHAPEGAPHGVPPQQQPYAGPGPAPGQASYAQPAGQPNYGTVNQAGASHQAPPPPDYKP